MAASIAKPGECATGTCRCHLVLPDAVEKSVTGRVDERRGNEHECLHEQSDTCAII
jgi:hypothetical protein